LAICLATILNIGKPNKHSNSIVAIWTFQKKSLSGRRGFLYPHDTWAF